MGLKAGLFSGELVGWLDDNTKKLWSVDLCPGVGGEEWCPPGVCLALLLFIIFIRDTDDGMEFILDI